MLKIVPPGHAAGWFECSVLDHSQLWRRNWMPSNPQWVLVEHPITGRISSCTLIIAE